MALRILLSFLASALCVNAYVLFAHDQSCTQLCGRYGFSCNSSHGYASEVVRRAAREYYGAACADDREGNGVARYEHPYCYNTTRTNCSATVPRAHVMCP